MELCPECSKVDFCKALAAINRNGIVTTKTVGLYLDMIDLFTTAPEQKAEYEEKIEIAKADHEAFVKVSRIDAELKGCTKLDDFPAP